MKFRLTPHYKGAPLPAWPFVGLGVAMLAVGGWLASLLPARWIPPCGFHTLTGHPCPSCGGTRMTQELLHGRWLEALRMNPLFAFVLAGFALWFLAGAAARLAGRDFTIDVGAREEKWLWLALLAAFLVNWVYLWRAGI